MRLTYRRSLMRHIESRCEYRQWSGGQSSVPQVAAKTVVGNLPLRGTTGHAGASESAQKCLKLPRRMSGEAKGASLAALLKDQTWNGPFPWSKRGIRRGGQGFHSQGQRESRKGPDLERNFSISSQSTLSSLTPFGTTRMYSQPGARRLMLSVKS